MKTLSASEILSAWESGEALSGEERARLLLSLAEPESDVDAWLDRSIGERNGGLLALRAKTLGELVNGYAACPECGERVEFSINVSDMLDQEPPENSSVFESNGYLVRFRLPTVSDLNRASACSDVTEAFSSLLMACILHTEHNGQAIECTELPEAVQEALANHMGSCDPQAESLFEMACPECGHGWVQSFDIAEFLWKEIRWHAYRLLREVDELARAYGWTESEILTLSPGRRRAYLELVQS